jgi:aminoglycoside phosphotransferase (APT) family kinase protein
MARTCALGQLAMKASAISPKPSESAPDAEARNAGLAIDDVAMRWRLGEYLSAKAGGPVEIEMFERRSPGFSWITYSFVEHDRSGRRHNLILRVGPPNGLFAPYSVLPQVYALQSMANSRVPVPGLVSYSEEGECLGYPFFICEHVAGDVAAPWLGSGASEEHRSRIVGQFIDILAELHTADWQHLPLRALADKVTPGERIERAPLAEWRRLISRPLERYYPLLDWAGHWLDVNCPAPPRLSIVHGDYRIGNFLELDGRITAILDWELAHIGDPHQDLAWALVPTFNGGSRKMYGVMERNAVIDRYQNAAGIALSPRSLAYYEALAFYQMAAIQICGIHAFEVAGFNDMRMAAMSTQMASIVRALDKAIEAAA